MASIDVRKNRAGEIMGYRVRVCVGRDDQYRQVWRTVTLPRPEGLTPARERKEIERQADAWAERQKAEFEKTHSKTDKQRITLAEFVREHWWRDHVNDGQHTPSTVDFFSYMSRDIVDYFGEKKLLTQVDAEMVKRYINYLRTEARTKAGKPYSQTTVQHHYKTLVNILDYARRIHYIDANPCNDLGQKEKPHKEAKRVDFLEPEDARRFLRCLEEEPLTWQCLVNVLITTGLRRGECVGLQWGDLDREKLTLTIRRNVTMDKNSPDKVHIGATKTKEARTVPISRRLYKLLADLKEAQDAAWGGTLLPRAFLFSSPADPFKPLYPTEPTRYLRKFVRKNHLPNVSPHDLRHTAASLALESGASMKEIQELLGHADPSTTLQFYTGLTEEAQRRTVEGIESLIG